MERFPTEDDVFCGLGGVEKNVLCLSGFGDGSGGRASGEIGFKAGDGEVGEFHSGRDSGVELNGVGDESESGIFFKSEIGREKSQERVG